MFRKIILTYALANLSVILLIPGGNVFAEPLDSDGDALTDDQEIATYHTDPHNPDTDGDGRLDGFEVRNGYSPRTPLRKKLSELDSDRDGLNDALEIALGTNLTNSDTDVDGKKDGEEVFTGFNWSISLFYIYF